MCGLPGNDDVLKNSPFEHVFGAALGVVVGLATAVPIVLLLLFAIRRIHDFNTKKGRGTRSFPWRRSLILLGLPLIKGAAGWNDGWFVLCSLVGLSVVFAELPLRLVLVPLGLVRTTFTFSWLAGHPDHRVSAHVGAAFWAAQALLRKPSADGARFLEARLSVCAELAPLGAAASALIALSRDQPERARGIFEGVASLRHGAATLDVASLAHEFRVLDAAGRGEWLQVSHLADFLPRSRLTRFLSAVARRTRYEPDAPSRFVLWLAWLLAPRRRATRELMRQALRIAPAEPVAEASADFAAQVRLVRCFPNALRREDLAIAARSLDVLRSSPKWLSEVSQRVQALGAKHTNAERVRVDVVANAEADLAEIMLDARIPAAWLPAGATGTAVRARVREGRVERVELLAKELHRRARVHHDLPEPDEWIAWGDLSRACNELLCDSVSATDQQMLFRLVHRPLWSYGYRQAFQRGQRALGRAAFQLQRDLAEAAQAFDAYATIDGNLTAARQSWSARLKKIDGSEFCSLRRIGIARRLVGGLVLVPIVLSLCLLVVWKGHPLSAFLILALIAAAVAILVIVQRRIVEVFETDDGVVLQNETQRYVAQRADVALRSVPPGFLRSVGVVRVCLSRAPWWLSRDLFTLESDASAAAACVARFEAGSELSSAPSTEN